MARGGMPGGISRRGAVWGAAVLGGVLALTVGTAAPASAQSSSAQSSSMQSAPAQSAPAHPGRADHRHGRALNYVALGDSYTSGPGIPGQVDANCARSDHNYPSLIAQARRTAAFTDVSCAGATTAEMWTAQGTNPPQFDALSRRTTHVTVGIGGNDVGFSSIIRTCAGLSGSDPTGSPCQKFYGSGGTDQLALKIRQTAPRIAAVLAGIHERAPRARVIVVGYPDLLPDNGVGCRPSVPFADGDFAYLRDTEKLLNATLEHQARTAHAEYVDTYRPTIGHDMCQSPADRWLEPLVPAAPAAPAHPNARGEQAMAEAILDRIAGTCRG